MKIDCHYINEECNNINHKFLFIKRKNLLSDENRIMTICECHWLLMKEDSYYNNYNVIIISKEQYIKYMVMK